MKFMFRAIAVAAVALASTSAVHAQRASNVQFTRGNYGTHLSGTISGREYFDYRISARRGQKLFVDLSVGGTNGDGSVYFNILPPGSRGQAIYNSSTGRNTTTVTLPRNGQYTIRVYLMGNDRSAGKTVGYEVDLSIQ
jgi:hypothetical protein